MREEISIFVSSVFNVETQVVIEEIFNLFDDLELPNYEERYIQLLMQVEHDDIANIAGTFRKYLDEDLTSTLSLFGITVVEETTLDNKCKLLTAIKTIEDYDNSTIVLEHVTNSGTSEERFAELLTLVTENSQEYWLIILDTVNDSLLGKIIEIHKTKASNESAGDDDSETVNIIATKLKVITTVEKYNTSFAIDLIRDHKIKIGLLFSSYIQIFNKLMDDKIIKVDSLSEIANQLYVFLIISRDGFVKPIETYQKYSSEIFDDLSKIAQVNHLVNANILELDNILVDRKNNAQE